jgi:mono/diheme cytochrome c family protein
MGPKIEVLMLLVSLASCGKSIVLRSGINREGPAAQGSVGGNAPKPDPSASVLFASAQAVFQQRCVSCHASYSANTEAQWVAGGSVVPAHPERSSVYSVLKGASVGGNETMPQGGTLSTTELDTLRNWILNISESTGQNVTPAQRRWLQAQSIIVTKCVSCHATQRPRFQATDEAEMLTHGSLVRPMNASNSTLVTISQSGEMPPSPRPALSATEIQTLVAWINEISQPYMLAQ